MQWRQNVCMASLDLYSYPIINSPFNSKQVHHFKSKMALSSSYQIQLPKSKQYSCSNLNRLVILLILKINIFTKSKCSDGILYDLIIYIWSAHERSAQNPNSKINSKINKKYMVRGGPRRSVVSKGPRKILIPLFEG